MLLALHSNFCLDSSTVDNCVAECAGAYALGRSLDANGTMIVRYIGRADDNVKARLKAHAIEGRFQYFAFTYSTGANPAYEKECNLYHRFERTLDDPHHPIKPFPWSRCPNCGG
jgi:hypothetical protein